MTPGLYPSLDEIRGSGQNLDQMRGRLPCVSHEPLLIRSRISAARPGCDTVRASPQATCPAPGGSLDLGWSADGVGAPNRIPSVPHSPGGTPGGDGPEQNHRKCELFGALRVIILVVLVLGGWYGRGRWF
jgi:hypothetical protein